MFGLFSSSRRISFAYNTVSSFGRTEAVSLSLRLKE